MINFRFHLISLVAVFLALGLGVAMGASFVDRATVDTLRARVDDLDRSYRNRGDALDGVTRQLGESDAQAAALAGESSLALDAKLTDQPVVLVTTDGVPGDVLDGLRTSLAAGGAVASGTVRLQPALSLQDADVLRSTRERFGLRGRPAGEVRDRVVADLGTALGLLAAEPAGAATTTVPAADNPTTTTEAPAVLGRPTDVASARAVLEALAQLGLVAVDTGGAPAGATFPDVVGVQYVLVTAPGAGSAAVAVPLATAVARTTPAVMTVAESRPSRPDGAATTTTEGQPARGATLAALRSGPVADRLSTVDDVEESFGRIATVYAVAEHGRGAVGHYGTGADAQAPFPTAPPG